MGLGDFRGSPLAVAAVGDAGVLNRLKLLGLGATGGLSTDFLFSELLTAGVVVSFFAAFLTGGGGRGMLGGGGIIRLTGRFTRWTLGRSEDLGGTGGTLARTVTGASSALVIAIISLDDGAGCVAGGVATLAALGGGGGGLLCGRAAFIAPVVSRLRGRALG